MSYTLGVKDRQPFIRCVTCGLPSFHPKDIEHKYCGKCGVFHAPSKKIEALFTRAMEDDMPLRQAGLDFEVGREKELS